MAEPIGRLAAARYLHGLGAVLHPIALGEKRPLGFAWQDRRFAAGELSEHFAKPGNVGVQLGGVSHLHLADVDLDCGEAIALAPEFLPPTAIFGRASKPRSHWIYRAPGAQLRQFKAPNPPTAARDESEEMLVELRANTAGARGGLGGTQTVFPPSVHPSGETVEWSDDLDAVELPEAFTETTPAKLTALVEQLAAACLIARHTSNSLALEVANGHRAMPPLPPHVLARLRTFLGVTNPATSVRETTSAKLIGDSWIDAVRSAGVVRVAHAFGLDVDRRGERFALATCPSCLAKQRSRHDRRPAAGVVRSREGVQLFVHGACKTTGDALALASCIVLRALRPHSSDEWRRLRAALVEAGVISS